MGDWRHGFSDPRYVVNLSKRVQTDLTSDALRHTEAEFMNLHDKIKVSTFFLWLLIFGFLIFQFFLLFFINNKRIRL